MRKIGITKHQMGVRIRPAFRFDVIDLPIVGRVQDFAVDTQATLILVQAGFDLLLDWQKSYPIKVDRFRCRVGHPHCRCIYYSRLKRDRAEKTW